ncbi:hypothetical protein B0T21DRAFT_355770 [Apiosordaria backusii]|uniref:Uncharacterized protein n=1 Tax=Apiosordaria backusii TaxID=314023 RepID=A0AA40EYV0_9PEZI|nr:hypothetical protein B0T21DRAFT_355770 [Apiosordaria backusii]
MWLLQPTHAPTASDSTGTRHSNRRAESYSTRSHGLIKAIKLGFGFQQRRRPVRFHLSKDDAISSTPDFALLRHSLPYRAFKKVCAHYRQGPRELLQ